MTIKLTGQSLVHNHHLAMNGNHTFITDRPATYAPFTLTIGDKSIKFCDYTGELTYYDGSTPRAQEKHDYTAKLPLESREKSYRQSADNSGKMYEIIEYQMYDPRIREWIEVHLQSWDRRDLYVWARIHDKGEWQGYSVNTAIATLDDKSAETLGHMFDEMR